MANITVVLLMNQLFILSISKDGGVLVNKLIFFKKFKNLQKWKTGTQLIQLSIASLFKVKLMNIW